MTIGEDIREKAQSVAVTNADWFANQLSSELSQSAETRFPEVGELCYFSYTCLLYTSPSPRDYGTSRMPSSA